MTVTDDITRDLQLTDTLVESTIGQEGQHRYALEAGARICTIPAVRAARVDSADLIGFIRTAVTDAPAQSYEQLAAAITSRFNLAKEES